MYINVLEFEFYLWILGTDCWAAHCFAFLNTDTQQKVEKLLEQITELKTENQKSNEEFGIQRGKMKELFLQKEGKDLFCFIQ